MIIINGLIASRKPFFCICLLIPIFGLGLADIGISEENEKPGIKSEDDYEHSKLMLNLVISGWDSLENERGTTCKYYAEKINLSELESILVISASDFKSANGTFGKDSEVWESCNYLIYSGEDSEEIAWFNAEKYFENTLSVLLLQELDADEGLYKALYVYKPRQKTSNDAVKSTSFWGDLKSFFWDLFWGHPKQ